MSEEGIVSRILATARDRGAKALAEAEAERDDALGKGMARLRAEFDAARNAAGKRTREAGERELSAFRLAERNRTHLVRRELLSGMYEAAWRSVLEPKTYRAWLDKRMTEYCREGDQIVVPAVHAELFSRDFIDLLSRHKTSLSAEKGSFRAGFVVPRGTVRLNCTLDAEMRDAVRESEGEIARAIFGKSAG